MKKIILFSIIAVFTLTGCTWITSENTSESPEGEMVFAVIGDNEGLTPEYKSFVRKVANDAELDFVVHLGDIVAHGGQEELSEVTDFHTSEGLTIPVYAVAGNHDIKDDENRGAFFSSFGALPRSIEMGNVHLVLLDNADRKVGFSDETLAWLEADLAQAGDKTILLVYHRPFGYPFAETLGNDETRTSSESNEKFKKILAPHEIAYMFNGHIHSYIEYPFSITDEEGTIQQTIPAVISGGGGQLPQNIFATFLNEDFHYLKIRVIGDTVSIEKISLP